MRASVIYRKETRPTAAFFSFASCEGCQLQVLSVEDVLLDLLGVVQIVNFREAIDERGDDYDIAFVEGSIVRPEDVEELQQIRKRAKILVAIGACACLGGVNAIRNRRAADATSPRRSTAAARTASSRPWPRRRRWRAW